jgi:hypothetical protein
LESKEKSGGNRQTLRKIVDTSTLISGGKRSRIDEKEERKGVERRPHKVFVVQ